MRNLSYALLFLGFIGAIACKVAGLKDSIFPLISMLILFTGLLILMISGVIRIAQGKVQIRPLDAAKHASVLFLGIIALRLIVGLGFPSLKQDAIEAVLYSAFFAIGLGLYSTAYRKPA